MTVPTDIAGSAALSICESLLLALNDGKILPEREILGILKDAAAAHHAAPDLDQTETHKAVAAQRDPGGRQFRAPALRRRPEGGAEPSRPEGGAEPSRPEGGAATSWPWERGLCTGKRDPAARGTQTAGPVRRRDHRLRAASFAGPNVLRNCVSEAPA
jgi:hypothetical protein